MPRGMLAAQVVALAFALPATAQERAPSLAVLEFAVVDRSPVSDPAAIRAVLASSGKLPAAWLAEALASIGSYRIVESPGEACSGAACALEIGKAMPASRVAYGTIVKVSNLIWYADAALVDVGAGRVLRSEELEIKGDIVQLLPKAMASMARRLAGADPLLAKRRIGRKKLSAEEVKTFLAATSEDPPPDLTDVDLSGLDLSGVDFKRANLARSSLAHARLKDARLFAVKLTDADAAGADLEGAVLDLSVLERTNLSGADLRKASLYAAILTDAVLIDADLRGARVIAPMSGARLARAKLADADLGADQGNQPMGIMRTDATSTDWSGADLTGANLRKVNFTRADLSGADLTSADVAGADFTGANLHAVRGRSQMRGTAQAKNLPQPEEAGAAGDRTR
ncbi:MAG: pentapeptide repeat-containing protein [Myxococcales bacterium]